jgi:hypothetical protein
LAEELRTYLSNAFHIAVRVREIKNGAGYRIFQVRKSGNRHLVDIRSVNSLPNSQRLDGVLVLRPPELIASKIVSYHSRIGKPKSGTDWRDLAVLLLAFPKLKSDPGPVTESLKAAGAGRRVLALWHDLVKQVITPENEDDDF